MRPPGNIRLFIALWPTDEVRDAIARWQAAWAWPEKAAVVKAERLHVTLHFLGDVAPARVVDLKYVLGRVVSPGFTLEFGHPEVWQHGVAVLRPDNSPTALRALHGRVGLALASIGLAAEDRTYRPHVTLARRAGGAKPPGQAARIAWESDGSFALVQTLRGGRGYEVLERFGEQAAR